MVPQVYNLLSGKTRASESWQESVGRAIWEKLKLPTEAFVLDYASHKSSIERKMAFSYPNLECEYERHFVRVELVEDLLGEPAVLQERFTTPGAGESAAVAKHHWAWQQPQEWQAIKQKHGKKEDEPEALEGHDVRFLYAYNH